MVMDALMLEISDGRSGFDHDGQLVASGMVCGALLGKLMAHPFLKRIPPKSTGREEFGAEIVDLILHWPETCDADRMATACQFTANSICDAIRFLPAEPANWFICGGGVRNRHLMGLVTTKLSPAEVPTPETAGIPPQAVEALSFSLLAHSTLIGHSNTLSAVTGACRDVCGGQITPGSDWQVLIQSIGSWIR